MRANKPSTIIYRIGGVAYVLAGAWNLTVAVVLGFDQATIETDAHLLAGLSMWIRDYTPICVVLGSAVAGVGKVARQITGPPKPWAATKELLDRIRKIAFAEIEACNCELHQPDPEHYHRVTLFRAVGFRHLPVVPWFRREWLVPYERSGHTTRHSRAFFRIPDDADKAEGIAGQTWATRRVVMVDNLPEMNSDASFQKVEKYARKTFVSSARVRKWISDDKQLARSFCGVPVEVDGKLWGVLVYDSRQPKRIHGVEAQQELAAVLGMLL